MAIDLTELVEEADRYLDAARIQDYCPNGLQVQGRPQVRRIVSGVTASQALLDAAVAEQADAVLVHHGYFWKGENPCVVGMKQRRLKTLLAHDISLIAYHLPLDLHPQVGNNVQLGQQLGLDIEGPLEPGNPRSIVLLGAPAAPVAPADFAAHVARVLGREPQYIASPGTYDQKHVVRSGKLRDCIAYGPGILDLAHQPDEYVGIAELVESAQVMALAALRLCGM